MLTRREVEGELRSLGFRASARQRRAEREKALRFVRGAFGVLVGVAMLALIGVVNMIHASPADIASGRRSGARATEWVSNSENAPSHHALSLFFTSRRAWGPAEPRGRGRHRGDD